MQVVIKCALVLLLVVLLHWIVVPPRWRSAFLLACSLLFVTALTGLQVLQMLLCVVLVHQACRLMRGAQTPGQEKRPGAHRRGRFVLGLILTFLVGQLCVFKYSAQLFSGLGDLEAWLSFERGLARHLPQVLFPLGLSYLTFRLIHVAMETYRGRITDTPLLHLGLYALFFPTYLAGPVERFERFSAQCTAGQGPALSEINVGLLRIISGIAKKALVADPLRGLILPVLRTPWACSRTGVISAIYGLVLQIYMDFSGYTDLALGTSRLLGYTIVENFDLPLLKPSLAHIWRSWHISVYTFIRDYFFLPLFGSRASPAKLYLGIMTTFMVFMLWHEGSTRFAVLGLYHGLGMAGHTAWQSFKRRHPAAGRASAHRELRPFWTWLSVTYFGLGFVLFVLDLGQTAGLLSRLLAAR